MPDVHHVAVLHDVFLAFKAEGAAGAGGGFRAGVEELVPANGFSPDEMFLQIRVDRSGSVLGACIHRDGPGPAFVFPGSKE